MKIKSSLFGPPKKFDLIDMKSIIPHFKDDFQIIMLDTALFRCLVLFILEHILDFDLLGLDNKDTLFVHLCV